MTEALVPILITIKRGDPSKGENQHVLPAGHNGSVIDQEGIGMQYGKTEQIGDGSPVEYAITAVPQWYADQYIKETTAAGEPERVKILTELEAEKFYLDHIPEKDYIVTDKAHLEILALKKQAGIALSPEEISAFDLDAPTEGIKRNKGKGFKAKLGKRVIKA